MSLPLSWLGVLLIWSTTPLAIKWSAEGAGVWFGVASRMTVGLLVCGLLLALLRRALPWDAGARQTYVAGGLGIWGAMTATYWASQFIPSGLMAVLFGLTPLITGVLAALMLGERALTPLRLAGLALAFGGLALVFLPALAGGSLAAPPPPLTDALADAPTPDQAAVLGIAAMLVAVLLHSLSTVWVKHVGARVPALATTTGALLVAVPLFTGTWLIVDAPLLMQGHWPWPLDWRTTAAILYLAVAGSALAFALYYHLLRQLPASRVAVIPLLTPVLALALGLTLNGEALQPGLLGGTLLILGGLALWQWGDRVRARWRLASRPVRPAE